LRPDGCEQLSTTTGRRSDECRISAVSASLQPWLVANWVLCRDVDHEKEEDDDDEEAVVDADADAEEAIKDRAELMVVPLWLTRRMKLCYNPVANAFQNVNSRKIIYPLGDDVGYEFGLRRKQNARMIMECEQRPGETAAMAEMLLST
jgi:hypothetical protein